jgi:hypothetical protein
VRNETGLKGRYSCTLEWTPESIPQGNSGSNATSGDTNLPSIVTAIREQLGLKVESRTGPGSGIVIDHVADEPNENCNCPQLWPYLLTHVNLRLARLQAMVYVLPFSATLLLMHCPPSRKEVTWGVFRVDRSSLETRRFGVSPPAPKAPPT